MISFTTSTHAQDWICFKSINQKKPINLAFSFSDTKNADAFIYYQKGSRPISLKMIKSSSENWVEGRPDINFITYKEMIVSKPGTYTISYQGAIFDTFIYTSYTNKKIEFEQDSTQECNWAN
jgi:hypothetical protein